MFELPIEAKAAIEALQFTDPKVSRLESLTASEWTSLLTRHEFVRLTIPLRQVCPESLPSWARLRIDRYIADNSERLERIKAAYVEAAAALRDVGADHIVVKGFAQWPGFTAHPCFHAQSDIDLYCPPDSILKARDAILALGYEPEKIKRSATADHLPALIRTNGWQWKGNHFDPELPPSIELHHSFWDQQTFRFGVTVEGEFWSRRIQRRLDDLSFPALFLVDNLGHSALQILKDCIIDAGSAVHLYEIARFLDSRAHDNAFWSAWSELHGEPLRRLEAIAFRAARDIFGCHLAEPAAKEVERLPTAIQKWFERFSHAMFNRAMHRPSAGIWLQMALIESSRDRRAVTFERLLPHRPVSLQGFTDRQSVHPKSAIDPPTVRQKYRQYLFMRARARICSFVPTLWNGMHYRFSTKNLSRGYWQLYAASVLFDFGAYIFFLLYNLYIFDRGFKEQFVGFVAGAAAIGSVVGTLLGGFVADRFGLRKMLLLCFPLLAAAFALRALMHNPWALVCLAFLSGAATVLWAVGLSPAVAQLTTNENRSLGFSVILSTGIGVGIFGGFVGGRLPGWLSSGFSVSAMHAKQGALLIGCVLIALATWPVSRVKFTAAPARRRTLYPHNAFLARFLPAVAVWSFVTGGLSPFFNVYFSQYLRMPVAHMGSLFSISHASQVLAVLTAPLLFRRLGLVKGIMSTQIAAGIALACLAAAPLGLGVVAAFTVFSAFEWMNEPGIFTLLMNSVKPEERTGASALMFLVISVSQAVAAALAGSGFARFGYPAVMFITAGVAVLAAVMFHMMLSERSTPAPASTHAKGFVAQKSS